jgi:hypothetical protein
MEMDIKAKLKEVFLLTFIGQTPVNCTLCLEFRIKDTNKNKSKITSSWTKATSI